MKPKLTDEQMQEVIDKYRSGQGTRLLAKEYGTARTALKRRLIRAGVYVAHQRAEARKVTPDKKTCCQCRVEKPKEEFSKDRTEPDDLQKRCKPCQNLRGYFNRIHTKYGISQTEWQSLWNQQQGLCGVCRCILTPPPDYHTSVDHCHATGRVRGLLCTACNTGLGHFKDNAQNMLKAAMYIQKWNRAFGI